MGRLLTFPDATTRRERLETEIALHLDRATALIARLDRIDADCDMEDDDPAGDVLDERGEAPSDDGTRILTMPPLYSVNQCRGPMNHTGAVQAYLIAQEGC